MAERATLPISLPEREELGRLEQVIERDHAAFARCGAALCTIRDRRLYRAEHATFDAYLLARWSFTRQHAGRLIAAAELCNQLVTSGTPAPANEAQARALATLPPELQAPAMQAGRAQAAAAGRKVTAADLERIAEAAGIDPGILRQPASDRERVERTERRVIETAARDERRAAIAALETWLRRGEKLAGRLDSGEQETLAELLRPVRGWLAGV